MASRHPERYQALLTRLKQARLNRGLRQEDVAQAIGEYQVYISRIESGGRRIDPIELAELAELYGVTMDALVHGDEGTKGTVAPHELGGTMLDITDFLGLWAAGHDDGIRGLMPLVYDELKAICRRRIGTGSQLTVGPTVLVNEVFIKFAEGGDKSFANRKAFFAYAAAAVHSLLVDRVRRKSAVRRGGEVEHITLEAAERRDDPPSTNLLDLNRILEHLRTTGVDKDARLAQVILLKIYTDLTDDDIAEVLSVSRPTVQRDWQIGKMRLARELGP